MCCRIADARENAPDICMFCFANRRGYLADRLIGRPDGLCQSTSNTDYIWRESCTDASWKSSQCLQLCVGKSNLRNPGTKSCAGFWVDDLHVARAIGS